MPTGRAPQALWTLRESPSLAPVIHRLGIETVPVDESSKKREAAWSERRGGPAPSSALGLRGRFSTRLFDWP